MRYKLIDFKTEFREETDGTCEMCMHTYTHQNQTFVLEDEDGIKHEINLFVPDRSYGVDLGIDNLAAFAAWLKEQDFKEPSQVYDYANMLTDAIDTYNRTASYL